jgi:DNA-binding CsgD family transcriptional regulator
VPRPHDFGRLDGSSKRSELDGDPARVHQLPCTFWIEQRPLTIPIHLPHGGLAFITAIADPERDDWAELVELSGYRLLVQAHQFQRIALEKLMPVSETNDTARLTSREAECLNLTGQGWSYSETARTLDLSIDTIRLHLRSACGKLGAVNRAHAIAKAITLGLIDINLRGPREGEVALRREPN